MAPGSMFASEPMKTLLFSVALMVCAQAASAQEAFGGKWRVVKAEPAPWAAIGAKRHAEADFAHASFEFRANRIIGPSWTACRKPKYDLTPQAFDSLFEGGLSDPEHGLKDAAALAHRLGFQREPVPSMISSCSELLFHLSDSDTALFALNNMIYTMKREHQ